MGSVKWLGAVVVLFAGCAPRSPGVFASQFKPPDDVAVIRAAADHFLRVFDDLDWELFRTSWASEPSVFFPSDDAPERVSGRAAVEARFRRFFDEVRAGTPGPPYLHLKPRELRVEPYGDAALVTFMLGEPPGRVPRRTLLFVREDRTWKLAHLHGSAAGPP
jgi:hypothetical protein